MKRLEIENLYGCPLSAVDLVVKVLRGVLCIPVCVDRNTLLHMLHIQYKRVAAQGLHTVIKWLTAAPGFLFYSGVGHETWTVSTELLSLLTNVELMFKKYVWNGNKNKKNKVKNYEALQIVNK